jgi:branched-subunit amino acid ABC-type transport system permease component
MTILATNYEGITEGFALLATLLVSVLAALIALLLSLSPRLTRASNIAANTGLAFSCLSTLLLFAAVYPTERFPDGRATWTQTTLIVVSSCAAVTLLIRGVAVWRASRERGETSQLNASQQ